MSEASKLPYYAEVLRRLGVRKFGNKLIAKLAKEARSRWYSCIPPSPPTRTMKQAAAREVERIKGLSGAGSINVLLFSPAEMENIAELSQTYREKDLPILLAEADRICQGEWQVLHRPFRLQAKCGWHIDPFSGRRWPQVYTDRIDIFSKRRFGDVWPIWELNRHQHLPVLGIAYRLTKDPKYVRCVVEHIRSWLEQNPYLIGINWRDGLQLATRIISWLLVLSLIYDSSELKDDDLKVILEGLVLHGYELRGTLMPDHELRNNHVIGEAVGLIALASLLPELSRGSDWFKVGLETLRKEMPLQTYSDGVNFEGATEYHLFVLEFLLLGQVVLKYQGMELWPELDDCLKGMLEFEAHVIRPDGSVPQFGDSCGGRAFRLGVYNGLRHRVALAIGAVLFDNLKFRTAASEFPLDALWILGAKGFHKFLSLGQEDTPIGSRAFRHAGWYVMRVGTGENLVQVMVDCGPVGMGLNGHGGHGHNDLLSFELSVGSRRLIIDSGTFTYHGDRRRRDYFRSAHAHNTVIVDGQDIGVLGPSVFQIQKQPQPKVLHWDSNTEGDVLIGCHDGYCNLPSPVKVSREISLMKNPKMLSSRLQDHGFNCDLLGVVMLKDTFSGNGQHEVQIQFIMSTPDHCITISGNAVQGILPTFGDLWAMWLMPTTTRLRFDLQETQVSNSYERTTLALKLVVKGLITIPETVTHNLFLIRPDTSLRFRPDDVAYTLDSVFASEGSSI